MEKLLSREAAKERADQEINQRWKLLLAICLDQIAFCKLSQPLQGHLFIILDCSGSQVLNFPHKSIKLGQKRELANGEGEGWHKINQRRKLQLSIGLNQIEIGRKF